MRRSRKLLFGTVVFLGLVLISILIEEEKNSRFPPPAIMGVRDFYVAVGSQVDYKKRITAFDETDGDLTEEIVADASEVVLDQPGEYTLVYRVENSHRRKARVETQVHVSSVEKLQERINFHVISPRDKYIVGALNAYDGGCYRERNVETVLEMMEPAFVRIKAEGVGHGSGFIMEITEEDICILTNEHVIQPMREPVVCFHDGTLASGEVIAKDTVKDIALLRVDRKLLSEQLVDGLKTVHVEKENWEALGNADISLGIRCIRENGGVWKEATGKLLSTEAVMWEFPHPLVQYTLPNFAGASGSAVLDANGNLIAMVLGVSKDEEGKRYWGVRLPDLLEFYEAATGRMVDYQVDYRVDYQVDYWGYYQ